jgi:hypothetical protein
MNRAEGRAAEAQGRPIPMPVAMTEDGRRIVVAVGVPSGDAVDTDFAMCMGVMMAVSRVPIVQISAKGCYVDKGRMRCVEDAKATKIKTNDGQEHGCSHLLFLDSDMVFPKETLVRLLSHNKLIVGALYSRRVAPFTNLGLPMDKSVTGATTGLLEMEWLATGCLLIDMRVFDMIPEYDEHGPVFGYRWMADLKEYEREDIRFCRLAREAGIQLWGDVDLSMHVGHIGQAIYRVQEDTKKDAAEVGIGADRYDEALPKQGAAE